MTSNILIWETLLLPWCIVVSFLRTVSMTSSSLQVIISVTIYSILSLIQTPRDSRYLFALSGIRINRCH